MQSLSASAGSARLFARGGLSRGLAAAVLAGSLFLAGAASAAELPQGDPANLGLSPDRLDTITAMLKEKIGQEMFPGAVLAIVRHGEVGYLQAVGKRTPGGAEMTTDSLFRIYSMTKPIVTAAAMMLVEEGKLTIGDPVARYIPEFKELQVAVDQPDGGEAKMEPARRPITVQDLMRHTAGLTYGFFGAGAARKAYLDNGIGDPAKTNEEFAKAIAQMPLEHQPGTTWEYSHATDVLGRVIEVVSGQPLGAFLKARIFDPLDMKDTGFEVADAANHGRIAEPMESDRQIGPVALYNPAESRAWESGGGGLVSTARDYSRFLQMMLNGGELDGVRILGPKTIAFMTADHLGPNIKPGKYYLPGPGYGFGLGFAVRTSEGLSNVPGSVGEYYWGGAAGTYFWVDPSEDMFVVYMMQSPKHRVPMRSVLRDMVYGAVVESGAEMQQGSN